MKLEQIQIGEFEVTDNVLVISDPCYEPGTWCMGQILDVKPGIWTAQIGICHNKKWGDRVAYLATCHKDCPDKTLLTEHEAHFGVGVDSGQAGIFDRAHYQDQAVVSDVPDPISDDRWYNFCCHQTLKTEHNAGVIPYGVVSSSGYGDGGYTCHFFSTGEAQEFTVWGVMIDFDLVNVRKIMEQLFK